MFGIINFETFIFTGVLLNLTPGTDTIYILSRSISQGKKAGIWSALGISTGGLVHCIFAALGLSIILAQSALAFNIVKYIGAAYLVYLGIKTILSKSQNDLTIKNIGVRKNSYKRIYISGILTNILNPKVALFFLAFLPQFINPAYAENSTPFIILGATFLSTGTIWCLILAVFSAKLSRKIKKNFNITYWLNKLSGSVFIFLGLKLALSRR